MPAQEVEVTDRLIRCFINVQRALCGNNHDLASRFVREERRNLGLPEPIPQLSRETMDKQGVQGEKRGRPIDGNTGHKRRRIEKSTNGRADILTLKPTPPCRLSDVGKTPPHSACRLQASSDRVQSKNTKANQFRGRPDNGCRASPKQTVADHKGKNTSIPLPRENRKKEKRRRATTVQGTANNTVQPHEHFNGSIMATPPGTDPIVSAKDFPRDTYTHSDVTAQEPDLKRERIKNSDSPSNDCISARHAVPEISPPIVEIPAGEKAFDEAIELPLLHNWLQEPVADGFISGVQNPGIEFCEEIAPPVSSVKSPLDNYPPIWAQVRSSSSSSCKMSSFSAAVSPRSLRVLRLVSKLPRRRLSRP